MTTHTLSTKPGDAASPDLCSLDPTELSVSGMSCASCAAKVERALNEQVGVTATVNYATASAYINRDSTTLTVDDLIGVVEGLGYGAEPAPTDNDDLEEAAEADDAAAKAQVHDLKIRFWVSAALALPVMVISMVPAWQFRGWQWVALALTTPVVVWGALPFHRATLTNLRHGTTTMDTLVSLGVLAAYGWSLWALFFGGAGELGMKMDMSWLPATTGSGGMGDMPGMDHTSGAAPHELYLEVAAVVPTFLLGGRWAEARAKRRAGSALRSLLRLGAQEARVVAADGTEVTVPASAVNVGQLLVVRPGERVPTDGEVTGGTSTIDASLLTGESVPVEVVPGDAITGATVNLSGRLEMRATRVGSDTQLARMGRLVRDAQAGKADAQRLADRVSAVFVPIVLLIAAATLTAWLALGQPVDAAIAAAVAVLVIACPCALGLATPTALLVGTGRGSQLGLLISGPQVLEATRDIDVMVLDKTGTITEGIMSLVDVVPGPGTERAELLRLVGSAESGSEHPIAAAITDAARYELGDLPPVESLTNHPGLGVRATVISSREHTLVLVGRPGLLADEGLVWPEGLRSRADELGSDGVTVVAAGWDGTVRGLLTVADTVRPDSERAIAALIEHNITPWMVTGDAEPVARAVAEQVGIDPDHVVAGVMPEDKVAIVARLQGEGHRVAMAGDGVNDAAALATADLGIAMGSGADVAMEASDLTIVSGALMGTVDAIRLSRSTLGTIKVNLFWAFGYNVAAIPLAAVGLLTPLIGGLAMAASSVLVVLNSLRLRRFQPTR
ncbi:heavy metal translocating P-type ATPase [Candidatus Microthrix sp.]|jgi:Cu+-exporting ATPase|uniref:heavy metal translocating P-type ATPase n=1 Tax=Candidatus Neomicrothrix sp. TaxID=2719034 RepID=UPI001B3E2B81|nr:heavy metal translocating P-type ATPase [Candidatus Microthrix sp.]MBP7993398.1 copper-translocating P-type ATPase [Candidatus Microthrix sp.]MBP8956564.1 copper-translocating P-type ATPase [Candidatus Microthrix sp.]